VPLRRTRSDDPLVETETWFLRHGMPYFVPEERSRVRAALAPRRFVPLAAAAVLVALVAGVLLAWVSDSVAAAPATLLTLALAGFVVYGLTALRARPILTYALGQTGASLGRLVPMATRALPLLLVFMTFLFINAEVWMMSAYLDGPSLWVTVLLFTMLGVLFFLTRLPEEIERADDDLDDERVVLVCRGTPMEAEAARLAQQKGLLAQESHVIRYERVNLTLVLVITQMVQTLLLSLSVFLFFLIFGTLTMQQEIVEAWVVDAGVHNLDWLPNLSVELLQVSTFLAAFAGLYFTVFAVTDDTYRQEFFTGVVNELERAIAVRAAYVAACRDRGESVDEEVEAEVSRRREQEAESREADRRTAEALAPDDQPTRQLPLE
jgi:hypothetical protein